MCGPSGHRLLIRTVARTITAVVNHLTGLVYPPQCISCATDVSPGNDWCSDCWAAVAISRQRPYCPACSRTLAPYQKLTGAQRCSQCEKEPKILAAVARAGDFDSPLGQAIRNFKYKKDLSAGRVLADVLADTLAQQRWADRIDAIVPIPSHWSRRWPRGIAHTQLLAEDISRKCAMPMLPALRCVSVPLPQAGLSAGQRLANVKGAFASAKGIPVTGATICLIDDVMTTAATIREAGRVLLRAGAECVYAAVIARAQLGEGLY